MKAFADYGDRHISQDVDVHAYKNGVRIWNQATNTSEKRMRTDTALCALPKENA